MRVRLLKGALLVGAIVGFSSGAASVAWRMQRHHYRHLALQEAAWERSSSCSEASGPEAAGPPPPPGRGRRGFGGPGAGHWGRWGY